MYHSSTEQHAEPVVADVGPALKLVAAVRQAAMATQQQDTGELGIAPELPLPSVLLACVHAVLRD
jgi:hypothetical protein